MSTSIAVILSAAKNPARMCANRRDSFWVYIVANERNGTIYAGVTNSLLRRIWQHKTKVIEGFTKQYGLKLLVYFEEFRGPAAAIAREKEIKGWLRRRKLALIEKDNPTWADLSADWYDNPLDSSLRSE